MKQWILNPNDIKQLWLFATKYYRILLVTAKKVPPDWAGNLHLVHKIYQEIDDLLILLHSKLRDVQNVKRHCFIIPCSGVVVVFRCCFSLLLFFVVVVFHCCLLGIARFVILWRCIINAVSLFLPCDGMISPLSRKRFLFLWLIGSYHHYT